MAASRNISMFFNERAAASEKILTMRGAKCPPKKKTNTAFSPLGGAKVPTQEKKQKQTDG